MMMKLDYLRSKLLLFLIWDDGPQPGEEGINSSQRDAAQELGH